MKLGPILTPKPIRLSISITPELKSRLDRYRVWHAPCYNETVEVADLGPFILAAFLDADSAFRKFEKDSLKALQPLPLR